MSVATPTRNELQGLPEPLVRAQESIHLPEVQEMLRRLSAYNLGICMPHMHDEDTGAFLALPDNVVYVENDQEVTFRTRDDVGPDEHFVSVGWVWRDEARTVDEMTAMRCVRRPNDTNHYSQRKPD